MFNGLIREIAGVKFYKNNVLRLIAKYKPNLGDSISINGACLSVIAVFNDGFSVELSKESRECIAIENLKNNVHIEPALKYGDRIEGHLMQGHIDSIGELIHIKKHENGVDFYINVPKEIIPLTPNKGSIGIDGISLTINEVFSEKIRVTIIPITFKESNFKSYNIGRRVNIETDLLARYVFQSLKYKSFLESNHDKNTQITWEYIDKFSSLY